MKFKLQLFALNTEKSVVDYMKSIGMDSSFEAREKLAATYGIENYNGDYDQNLEMMKMLKSETAGKKVADELKTAPSANTSAPSVKTVNGVDQKTLDKMNSTFTASDSVNNAQKEADAQKEVLKGISSVTDIIGQDTWDAINKKFEAPSAYTEAMNLTNSLREQLTSGRTSYSDQIDAMISKIQNRDAFEYDVDSDMLFQQYLASSMASGKTAMQDTLGQAAALTGGYGSTYATSAGNQAYNAYIQDAYNNLPEYYQMAMEAYQMEGEEMYNQLAMLGDADSREYERLFNAYSVNNDHAQDIYNKAYGEWQDSVSNAFNSAGLQLQEHGQLYDQAYNTYMALQDNAQNLYNNEYTKWADEVSAAYKYAGMLNSDYWNNAELTQRKDEFNAEMDYKKDALEWDQKQYTLENDVNGDGVVDYNDVSAKKNNVVDTLSGTEINQKYYQGALEAYNGGGVAKLNEYINSLAGTYSEEQLNLLAEYAAENGYYADDTPYEDRNWTVVKKGGINWGGSDTIDNNGKVSDGKNEYDLKTLYNNLIAEGKTEAEAKKIVIDLQKELGISK